MKWEVCLEMNTGLVCVPVSTLFVLDAKDYRELLAAGIHLQSLNGRSADETLIELAPAVRRSSFAEEFRAECWNHPKAIVSVRQ